MSTLFLVQLNYSTLLLLSRTGVLLLVSLLLILLLLQFLLLRVTTVAPAVAVPTNAASAPSGDAA